jgi:predicted kinase
MPKLFMLIGVPGSGKSTWIREHSHEAVIASTDDYIEAVAAAQGLTYNEVFETEIKAATAALRETVKQAVRDKRDIIWDQTNLTAKTRRGKLGQVPKSYERIALFFPTPDGAELERRLAGRAGKTIPVGVMTSMIASLEPPGPGEDFDEIYHVPVAKKG